MPHPAFRLRSGPLRRAFGCVLLLALCAGPALAQSSVVPLGVGVAPLVRGAPSKPGGFVPAPGAAPAGPPTRITPARPAQGEIPSPYYGGKPTPPPTGVPRPYLTRPPKRLPGTAPAPFVNGHPWPPAETAEPPAGSAPIRKK